jgi:hypothetical protein
MVFDIFGPIEDWDVSLIRDFSELFSVDRNPAAATFNADVTAWDTSNAETFATMFLDAEDFNQPIGEWITSNVQVFTGMFSGTYGYSGSGPRDEGIREANRTSHSEYTSFTNAGANAFDQDISSWDVSAGLQFDSMFAGKIPSKAGRTPA